VNGGLFFETDGWVWVFMCELFGILFQVLEGKGLKTSLLIISLILLQ
jgi:hypothetical protein